MGGAINVRGGVEDGLGKAFSGGGGFYWRMARSHAMQSPAAAQAAPQNKTPSAARGNPRGLCERPR